MGAVLGAHPAAVCVPESQFLSGRFIPRAARVSPFDPSAAYEQIRSNFRFYSWSLPASLDDAVDRRGTLSYANLVEALVWRYAAAQGRPDAEVWVDHTPSNTRRVASLIEMFPDARFIHLVRDGRAVHASIRSLDWGPNVVTASAAWWVEQVAHGLAAESKYGPEWILRVRYEDLVLRTGDTVRAISVFAGLSFDPVMLEASGFEPPAFTSEEHALVGLPPDRSRVDAWKASMSDRQVEIFESLTGDFLSYLGYEPVYGARAERPTVRERLALSLEDFAGRLRHRVHRQRRSRQARLRVATNGSRRRREDATVPSSP